MVFNISIQVMMVFGLDILENLREYVGETRLDTVTSMMSLDLGLNKMYTVPENKVESGGDDNTIEDCDREEDQEDCNEEEDQEDGNEVEEYYTVEELDDPSSEGNEDSEKGSSETADTTESSSESEWEEVQLLYSDFEKQ